MGKNEKCSTIVIEVFWVQWDQMVYWSEQSACAAFRHCRQNLVATVVAILVRAKCVRWVDGDGMPENFRNYSNNYFLSSVMEFRDCSEWWYKLQDKYNVEDDKSESHIT